MQPHRRELLACVGASATLLASRAPAADTYPSRPVKLIVPFPAGGSVDPAVRVLAEALSRLAGQNIVVDNRSGAGGTVGADNVAKAEPDGYTLLASNGAMTAAQALNPKLPWDVERDFTHIGGFATLPSALLINTAKVPVRTLPELVGYSASRSPELTYGSPGIGTASHLAAELLKERSSLRMTHVPYRGAGPASTDLLAGHIDLLVAGFSTIAPLLGSPDVLAIAVTSETRVPQAPQVPTVAETYPGFDYTIWLGLAGPAGLPAGITERIAGWLRTCLADPTVDRRLVEIGVSPGFTGGGEVLRTIRQELASFPAVARRVGIRVD